MAECRSFGEAAGQLQAGIAYCTDRDLDTWRLYMRAWLARSLAEQGHHAAAQQHPADITRHPHLSPITQVSHCGCESGRSRKVGSEIGMIVL